VAAINLMEKKETQEILGILKIASKTAKELNQIVVIEKSICSTATLYRRLSELQMASIIIKTQDEFELTPFGRSFYRDFISKATLLVDSRMHRVLNALEQDQLSTTDLLSNLSISPNDLIEILHQLEKMEMIEQELHHSGSTKGGRPRKVYRVSERGHMSSEEYKKLRNKVEKK
jgi:DNA-binding HxlR family transcriptional regulator